MRVALAPRHRGAKGGLLEEITVLDAFVDSRQVLIYDAARAHRDVYELRVSRLPGRQAHVFARRLERRMRKAIEELEVGRRARQLDGIPGALFTQAPPIATHE